MINTLFKCFLRIFLFSFCLIGVSLALAAHKPVIKAQKCNDICQWGHHIGHDYKNYYSTVNLLKLGGGFAVGAVIANTNLDQRWSNYYQQHWRSRQSDKWAVQFKKIGSPPFALTYVAAYGLGRLFHFKTATIWSQRSMRALLVGLPPMWLLQKVTGGDRPRENKNSHWHFWQEPHGVSGHAFMGAVPFLTAASMTHNVALKSVFYLGASFAGLSRINDAAHYPSQVLLGWWMAYLAVNSVNETNHQFMVSPILLSGGGGLSLSANF